MMVTGGILILTVLLVHFGLQVAAEVAPVDSHDEKQPGEQQPQIIQSSYLRLGRRRRRRRRRLSAASNDPRNRYWDLPESRTPETTESTSTAPGQNNPQWQQPPPPPPRGEANEVDRQSAYNIKTQEFKVYHSAEAKEKSSASTLQNKQMESYLGPTPDIQDEDLMMRMAQNVFVQQCMDLLQVHSDDNNHVNRDRYVNFLQEISTESLDSQITFEDLPLFLAMIFFSASCSSGQDCVAQEPVISITPVGTHENMMNQVLCRQLMRFPFMEILLPFQFLIRVNSGLSASELLLLSEQEEQEAIIDVGEEPRDQGEGGVITATTANPPTTSKLEGALDQVLLRGLNCTYIPKEVMRYDRQRSRRERIPPRERSRRRQPQPQGDCDFVVQVTVEDAADYPCGFQSSCILIFSDVTVYAVLKDTLDEPKLREITSDVLRDAINGNALNDYLQG